MEFNGEVKGIRSERAKEKKCRNCGQVKPSERFDRDKLKRDGLASWCKECRRQAERATRAAHKAAPPNPPKEKRCSKCRATKPAGAFDRNYRSKDGLRCCCKDCRNNYARTNYRVHQQKNDTSARKQPINTWSQVDSVVREMAEQKLPIDYQVAAARKQIARIIDKTALAISPNRQHLESLKHILHAFLENSCGELGNKRLVKQLTFGTVYFYRGEMDIDLDVALAAERLGKP